MKRKGLIALTALLIGGSSGQALAVPGDANPRAMGLGQAYTALARGPEAPFWNPANLALSSRKFDWDLVGIGFTLVAENNSFSVTTYNDNFTDSNTNISPNGSKYYISPADKDEILGDIPGEGLKMNVDIDPILALGIPINGGVAFSIGEIRSAIAIGLTTGFEGEIPKDMFELFLFGNEFEETRLAAGKDGAYDISDWDGSGWAVGTFNWSAAKAFMPAQLKPYLSEFSAGGTLKFSAGAYGEILKSGGTGLVSRVGGADLDVWLITQSAETGTGFGLDFGVAGVTKNRKATISLGFLNLLDTFSWSSSARQDSIFVRASDLRITRFADEDSRDIEDVLDNPDFDDNGEECEEDSVVPGCGDTDFNKLISEDSFSRSLPAMMRLGVAYQAMPKLTGVSNWDQAFSSGFGVTTTPRLAAGVEYRLVDWFPARFGLSLGGRSSGSSIGFAFGPFVMPHLKISLLETALVSRGGFFPGIAKGTAISLMFFRINFI